MPVTIADRWTGDRPSYACYVTKWVNPDDIYIEKYSQDGIKECHLHPYENVESMFGEKTKATNQLADSDWRIMELNKQSCLLWGICVVIIERYL